MARWDANDMLALAETWQRGDVTSGGRGVGVGVGGWAESGALGEALGGVRAEGLIMPCRTDLYFCVSGPSGSSPLLGFIPAVERR